MGIPPAAGLPSSFAAYFAKATKAKKATADQTPSLPDPGPATNATLKKQIPIRHFFYLFDRFQHRIVRSAVRDGSAY